MRLAYSWRRRVEKYRHSLTPYGSAILHFSLRHGAPHSAERPTPGKRTTNQWTVPVYLRFREQVSIVGNTTAGCKLLPDTHRKQTNHSGHVGLRSIHWAAETGVCWPIDKYQGSQQGVKNKDELRVMQAMNASNRWTLGWHAEASSVKFAARCGTLGGAATLASTSLASGVSVTQVNMASAACQEHVTWIMCVFEQHSDNRTVVQNQTYLQQQRMYVACIYIYIYIVCRCVCIYVCMYVCIYIYIYIVRVTRKIISVCVRVRASMCVHVCVARWPIPSN